MNKLTVVIPSIGKSDKLDKLIDDLKNKCDYKVVLIDNTRDAVLSKKYKEKVTYVHEPKPGTSIARNTGFLHMESEYYLFLDDDIELTNSFMNALNDILISNLKGIFGGKVIVDYYSKKLPTKYRYIIGHKDLGNKVLKLKKDYLGGCCMLVSADVLKEVGGFTPNFGKINSLNGANEDVLFQDQARKKDFHLWYYPMLSVKHFWSGNEDYFLERVKLQGMCDQLMDYEYFRMRYYLKLLKYNWFLIKNLFKPNQRWSEGYYDAIRYKAYIQNRRRN